MKRTKLLKAVAFASLAGVLALTATSCSNGDTEDLNHTIYFYNSMGKNLQAPLEVAIAEYESRFPGWKVKSINCGGYDDVRDTIVADITGDTQPDLAYCYADHVAMYLPSNKVVNMNKFINSTEKVDGYSVTKSVNDANDVVTTTTPTTYTVGYTATEVADFVPGYWAEGKASNYANYSQYGYGENDMLTVPFMKSTEVMYVNETALINAGITNEDGSAKIPTTWDELWANCRVLLEKYPGCFPLGYDSDSNWFITMCEQNGWGYTSAQGAHYQFNNADTTAWLEKLAEYYEAGLFTTQKIYGGYTSSLFTTNVGKDDKGANLQGCVFCVGSSAGASYQDTTKFQVGVYQIPGSVVNGKTVSSCISQGPSLVMFETRATNNEEKQVMTWEFVKLLLEPATQASFSKTAGYNSCRKSTNTDVADYAAFLAEDTLVARTANLAASLADLYYTSPAFNGSSTARDQVGTALVYAATAQKDAAKALSDALKKCGGNN